jgi:hypothetical protein
MIAKEGWLTLIKSVLLTMSIHQLVVMEAPIWLLDEINKLTRPFLWAGKKEANGGDFLLTWERVCKLECFGGIGVKNLRLPGLALCVCWEWLKKTDR